jgi:cytochrome c peroxidase
MKKPLPRIPLYLIPLYLIPLYLLACKPQIDPGPPAEYDPTLYETDFGYFPQPDLPQDNQLTNAGVALGRMLFYETMLSKDNSQSCATCHIQKDGFSDIRRFSEGVEGLLGERQAMGVFNLAWHQGFFWDGRAATLREQALMPIQDPLEMNETLENVVNKLSADKRYTDQFIRAFGDEQVSSERISLALEQFMLTIVSYESKFDRVIFGNDSYTEAEQRGFDLFFTEFDPNGVERGAECFHCHAGFDFTNHEFMNNGLDAEGSIADPGLYEATGDMADFGKFKVPSLRNIAMTPPFMHDGRFASLEEVLDHYNTGVKTSPTLDPLMQYNVNPGLNLTEQEKADLIAFLHTLTDSTFLNKAEYTSPF